MQFWLYRTKQFNEKDWLRYQKKLQIRVVNYLIGKLKTKQLYQSIDEAKAMFLRQQFRVIEDLRDILKDIKMPLTILIELKKQREEQLLDFIESLYDK